jgi:hypothetical protein
MEIQKKEELKMGGGRNEGSAQTKHRTTAPAQKITQLIY